jgi:hypothetical protein
MRAEPLPFPAQAAGAWINPRGNRRYLLWRPTGCTGPDGRVAFIMLNPSDANAISDDPTIRRCRGFARDWGYTHLFVGNLYSIKGSDPKAIDFRKEPDLLGDRINEAVLDDLLSSMDRVVVAWGSHPHISGHAEQFRRLARDARCDLYHLGLNADGSPKHPLYLPKETKLEEWT